LLNTTNSRKIIADSDKYIKSLLNPWSYIKEWSVAVPHALLLFMLIEK
jgi:hypothetical protein